MKIKEFFDASTGSFTYIVSSEENQAIIIDPVLNFDKDTCRITEESLDCVIDYLEHEKLRPIYVLETHVHADHLSSSARLKDRFPDIKICINRNITKVQKTFADIFGLSDFPCTGDQFDMLLNDNEEIELDELLIKVIFTPGHTPACTSFLIEEKLFVGDTLFMPDFGTGRCDFPKGSSRQLYESIQRLYRLPDETEVYVGHDYAPGDRGILFSTTIEESREKNIHLSNETTAEEFVKFRDERDTTLSNPKLLYPGIRVNMDAGKVPNDLHRFTLMI